MRDRLNELEVISIVSRGRGLNWSPWWRSAGFLVNQGHDNNGVGFAHVALGSYGV